MPDAYRPHGRTLALRPAIAVGVAALALALGCSRRAEPPPESSGATAPEAEAPGAILVEELARGSPLATAGLEVGDRLIAWRRGGDRGLFDSWDDLSRLESEQAPLGPVQIQAERAGRRFEVELREDRWRARARPALAPDSLAEYRRALVALAARDPATAQAAFASLSTGLRGAADRSWIETRMAGLPQGASAVDSWSRALTSAAEAQDPELEGWVALERCTAAVRSARFADARTACARARELRQGSRSPLALLQVRSLEADLAGREGDPREEERRYRELLVEVEPIAKDSLFAARLLRGLAKSRASQDDLVGAFDQARRALALVERRAPRSLEHQNLLTMLAIFHWFRAEWDDAERLLGQAMEILQSIDPEHEDLISVLFNTAMVAADRGDVATAELTYMRVLELRASRTPDPLTDSRIYNNLATIAARRGDFATALRYDRQVLELRERLAPRSIDLAIPLHNLGEHSRRAGEHLAAVGFLERALEIQRLHAPASRGEAATLVALSEAQAAGADARAESTAVAALTLAESVAPGSVTAAAAQRALAERRAERGEIASAENLLLESARTFSRLIPGTVDEALTLFELGQVRRRAKRPEEALTALFAAASALDRQLATLGSTDEVRARFRESWRHVYDELADLLREMGRTKEAFEVLERARSRAFLFLLRSRQIDLAAHLPAELAAEREAIAKAYAEVQKRLATPEAAHDLRALGELDSRRRELQQRRDRLAESAGKWSPRLAGLEAALDVDEARAVLGPSLTAISYSVGERTSRAWIIGPGDQFEVVDLGVGEDELRDLVRRYRLLLESGSPVADPGPLGERLHALLIAPVADLIQTPGLVLVPDGPLHHLPFAALVTAGGSASGKPLRYLAEWKPLQIAGSLSAWAGLRLRANSATGSLSAFADPTPSPTLRWEFGPPSRWRSLPYGRREAEHVADLYSGEARAYVGRAATEREAKRIGRGVRILHFATHAYVDASSPLDSALVLAPGTDAEGRREDGLLQGWEVLQELHLDADLVVLSGCETAGGTLVADEGILGLTRTFQFAGARAVLASLWPISDRGTAGLMERFYRELAGGRSADEALRIAQLSLLERAETAHPGFWAAFQLHGAAGAEKRPSHL